jgi:hypothetical protein
MEKADLRAHLDAQIVRGAGAFELAMLKGRYTFECIRPKSGMLGKYEPLFVNRSNFQNRLDRGEKLTDDELARFLDIQQEMDQMSDLVWGATADNTVCTVGKNLALDTFLAGSAYTVVGPFLGLISSASYSATAAGDTMASHAGWTEAGTTNAPQWTTPASGARHTTNAGWASASAGSKALSAAKAFSISTAGTVKGAFLVYGTGAVATAMDTNGTLMSAGVFSGGDKVVANLDTLNVSYSLAF